MMMKLSLNKTVLAEDSLDRRPEKKSSLKLEDLSLLGDSEHVAPHMNVSFHDSTTSIGSRGKVYSCVNIGRVLAKELTAPEVREPSRHVRSSNQKPVGKVILFGSNHSASSVSSMEASNHSNLQPPTSLVPPGSTRRPGPSPKNRGAGYSRRRNSCDSLDDSTHSFALETVEERADLNGRSHLVGSRTMPSMMELGTCNDESNSSFTLEVGDEVQPTAPFATQTDSSSEQHQEYMTLEAVISQAKEQGEEEEDEHLEEIEVSPGVYLPFRGKRETWQAVAQNRTLQSICMDCGIQLISVDDCEHVLCPDCTMLNPVFEHPPGTVPSGVGMGLRKEWLDM